MRASAGARAAPCTSPTSTRCSARTAFVGGGPLLVRGVDSRHKIRGTKQVGVSFTGDGGANQGTFLESLNLASAWDLPCIFVIENNGYAEATAQAFYSKDIDIAKRGGWLSMPGVT